LAELGNLVSVVRWLPTTNRLAADSLSAPIRALSCNYMRNISYLEEPRGFLSAAVFAADHRVRLDAEPRRQPRYGFYRRSIGG
jgi:hypothetical protein